MDEPNLVAEILAIFKMTKEELIAHDQMRERAIKISQARRRLENLKLVGTHAQQRP